MALSSAARFKRFSSCDNDCDDDDDDVDRQFIERSGCFKFFAAESSREQLRLPKNEAFFLFSFNGLVCLTFPLVNFFPRTSEDKRKGNQVYTQFSASSGDSGCQRDISPIIARSNARWKCWLSRLSARRPAFISVLSVFAMPDVK